MTHYLTRAVLNRRVPEHALRPLLDPSDKDTAFDAHHRLIWTLFPDRDAKRDFLWRSDDRGRFMILSARQPQDTRLFEPLESKTFAPVLTVGDRLAFKLRANATKDRRSGHQDDVVPGARRRPRRDRRVDVVMHAMQEQGLERGRTGANSRSARRMDIAEHEARVWLTGQGERRGFSVEALAVDDYSTVRLNRRNDKPATFGILDLRGLLTVRDPEALIGALLSGFGRAKAYGCGLMLVRRA